MNGTNKGRAVRSKYTDSAIINPKACKESSSEEHTAQPRPLVTGAWSTHPVLPTGSIDAGDPEPPHVLLPKLSRPVGMLQRLLYS